jgi:hypothetical protein
MQIQRFLQQLHQAPEQIQFSDTMALIDALYDFTPCGFHNGELHNAAGQNSGSCKLLAFARQQNLSEAATLNCFGAFYRDDVLKNLAGSDHQNIRTFMRSGWGGVKFDGVALTLRAQDPNQNT